MQHQPFRPGIDYMGRPDLNCILPRESRWWITKAKRHMPYVHSTSRNACLIHKVASVQLRWYDGAYDFMRRREKPSICANCVCGQTIYLNNGKRSGKMCEIPDPNAVLCGRCHGEIATFSLNRTVRIKRRWAKDHLGCKGIQEVIGAYQQPAYPMT